MHPDWPELIQSVQTQTASALVDGTSTEFIPTLTRITKDEVKISLLLRNCSTSDQMLEAIESLGFKSGRRNQTPDFVFFAAEVLEEDGNRLIMLSGCSKELEAMLCYLSLESDADRRIRPRDWSAAGPVAKDKLARVPAYRALCGAKAKAESNPPWWRFW